MIALQEVRSGKDSQAANQILELKTGLPAQFKWHVFKVANNVSFIDKSIDQLYPGEGNAIDSLRHFGPWRDSLTCYFTKFIVVCSPNGQLEL